MYCDIPILTRCCLCLPLRRGILGFGYINLIITILSIAAYSDGIHRQILHNRYIEEESAFPNSTEFIDRPSRISHSRDVIVYHGLITTFPVELCLFSSLVEFVATVILLYGAHMSKVFYLNIFFYYDLVTTAGTAMLQVIFIFMDIFDRGYAFAEIFVLLLFALMIHVYLLITTRSLIRKLQTGGPNVYVNQLQQIVVGDQAENGIYNHSTVVDNPAT